MEWDGTQSVGRWVIASAVALVGMVGSRDCISRGFSLKFPGALSTDQVAAQLSHSHVLFQLLFTQQSLPTSFAQDTPDPLIARRLRLRFWADPTDLKGSPGRYRLSGHRLSLSSHGAGLWRDMCSEDILSWR
jgi:hypothetical protein